MEMNKRDLERLREIEQMSSSSDEEVMLLRKQLVQARSRTGLRTTHSPRTYCCLPCNLLLLTVHSP